MTIKFNDQLLMWGLGVIQPASPLEVAQFLRLVYPAIDEWPDEDMLNRYFESWCGRNYIVLLNKKYKLYSLAALGNQSMEVGLRRHRDKARITLLRAVYDATLNTSEVVGQDLDGDSPSLEARVITQEGSRPVNSGSESSRAESTRLRARIYWPRVSEQLKFKVGLDFHSSDIPSYRYRYCSFPNLKTIKEASEDVSPDQDLNISQLGLCIGVSPRLLTSFIHKPENHYRTFFIGKKSGGQREISSPRFFLKTTQYWIRSYILWHLNIHASCHAFLPGRSIISNAKKHLSKDFVANIDIENFFGSISRKAVFSLLRENNIGEKLSNAIAQLTTYKNALPQGAPTSPDISNAILFKFDEAIWAYAGNLGLEYSRYADDITISGDSRKKIDHVVEKCRHLLESYGLRLNNKKTRIASKYASQRVTGLVVNEKIQPPRSFQRKVRAIFHKANSKPELFFDRIDQLRGYYSYLSAFDVLRDSVHLRRYKLVINKLNFLSNTESAGKKIEDTNK